MTTRSRKEFSQPVQSSTTAYGTVNDHLTVDDKLKILEKIGQPELVDLFKEWKPRPSRKRRTSIPLDQRVAITVTDREKVSLDNELKGIKQAGSRVTASQFIRDRALGSVDLIGWRTIAEKALIELNEIDSKQSELRERKKQLAGMIEDTDDSEEEALFEREIHQINSKISRITAQNEKRVNRLTGRMSTAESETVKWRANRLCISASDYLRMMIFQLEPDSPADAHMSLDAKRRFYVSIIAVAENGFGDPPAIQQCSKCSDYIDEIAVLRDRVKQLETFV